jgi:acyl carrier protein
VTTPSLDAIRQAVIESVLAIAPEADFATVVPTKSLREQLDLDSFDYLNVLISLHKRLNVEVPEADYGKVETLERLIAYLAERLARV